MPVQVQEKITAEEVIETYRQLGWPILFEDDEEGDLGENNSHVINEGILRTGLIAFLRSRPEYRVYENMNLYYTPVDPKDEDGFPYVSPDIMVVAPKNPKGQFEPSASYRIDRDGPPPVLVAEALSPRSAQQRDLHEKMELYALLEIPEYLLIDTTGIFLKERLMIKKLRPNGEWANTQDADGGITSDLGFRVIIEDDSNIRLIHAETGEKYLRPDEAQEAEEARRKEAVARKRAETARKKAEERVKELEVQIARIEKPTNGKPNK